MQFLKKLSVRKIWIDSFSRALSRRFPEYRNTISALMQIILDSGAFVSLLPLIHVPYKSITMNFRAGLQYLLWNLSREYVQIANRRFFQRTTGSSFSEHF